MRKISIICFVVIAIFFFARSTKANIQIDQSNLPIWGGGWTAMSWDQSQTFQPGLPILTGVDIDILTANQHLGDVTITVEILKSDVVLATASKLVTAGFDGLLHFDFPAEVAVNVGETYVLSVPGTKDTFGWKFGGDTYSNGIRFLGGEEKPHTDWLFQTYGIPAIGAPPIADAGPDQTVTDFGCNGSEPVVLDGSGSSDPDGEIVNYQWWASPTGNPEDLNLIAEGSTATVTLSSGTYTVMLIVVDDDGATDTDTVEITVSVNSGDKLCGTVTTTDPEGVVHALSHIMVTLDWGGTQHTVYTNDNGDYVIDMSANNTFYVGSAVSGFLIVTLEDEGNGTDPYIKVYNNNAANPIFAETVNFKINTLNDLEQNVDLSENANINFATLPIWRDHLDDSTIIYFHTYQALDFALNTLGLSLDCSLPVEVLAWSGVTLYRSGISEIEIKEDNSDFTSGNRPDNREWHEFSHFIMDDSTIAGDNALPLLHTGGFPSWPPAGSPLWPPAPTSGDTNHGGYANDCTSDSWIEGFAVYISCLIAEKTGDQAPTCYAIGGNTCAVNIEANWLAWETWQPWGGPAEEYAVAGLLWDLQDGINANDSDWIDLTATQLWNLLNNADHQNVHDIYLTLNNLNLAQLTGNGDPAEDEIDNLDELFIAHGLFSDANGNKQHDDEEAVGFTGNAARPNREATPEIPGSYIIVNVIDSSTLTQVDVSEFDVEMRVEPPHDYLNVNFTIQNRNQSLYFMMPPPNYSAKAYIYAKKNGYHDSTPLVIDSSFYWERMREPGLEYLTEHTFYLKPGGVEVCFVTLASPSPSDTTETLPPSISSVSKGQDYYIEIWASDVGSTNTGLTSVYVDMHFDPCDGASVQEIDHSGIFTESKSGTIEPWGIDELGGSCLDGVGIAPEWARVAVVKVRVEAHGTVCFSLFPSDAGITTLDRGLIPWSEIIFSWQNLLLPLQALGLQ